jgi:ABC-type Fe3+ transport system substrate-binding protein
MITGNESLLQIAESGSELIPIFQKHGLGSYFEPSNLEKTGRYIKLSSLLHARNIESVGFIGQLNQALSEFFPEEYALKAPQEKLHFTAMLPCGLRNPFKEYFESVIQDNPGKYRELNFLIEGNVNHELSYYPLLDSITDSNELPDVIMASDVNNFFHRPFVERFINKGLFSAYMPFTPNPYLEKAGFADPKEHYTMYTANLLVMAVEKSMLENRDMPVKWADLLSRDFKNDIIIRGEDDFFCNAVMLPYYKDNGFEAVRALAANIKCGMHPSEMVKLAGTGKPECSTVYIMPYFFAKRIQNKHVEIVWPSDGAIISPVFMLVNKEGMEKHRDLLDFLMSKETGEMLTGRHFPSIHPKVSCEPFPDRVKWLGWDFIYGHDMGALKAKIQEAFMEVWNTKTKNA